MDCEDESLSASSEVVKTEEDVLKFEDMAVDVCRCGFQRQTIVTSPAFVNLTAFETKFPITCIRSHIFKDGNPFALEQLARQQCLLTIFAKESPRTTHLSQPYWITKK